MSEMNISHSQTGLDTWMQWALNEIFSFSKASAGVLIHVRDHKTGI
jgi:hypothetical protein